ncbi:MAG: Tn3 family transposase, partial [Anaerolinea sp.]|nr:Tn3 family transposase [Anaerolinea sp.]
WLLTIETLTFLQGRVHLTLNQNSAYGGIAYHHISDTYIALFSHFIACGVWEAVYILDGLLQNKSVLQPDTMRIPAKAITDSGPCRYARAV